MVSHTPASARHSGGTVQLLPVRATSTATSPALKITIFCTLSHSAEKVKKTGIPTLPTVTASSLTAAAQRVLALKTIILCHSYRMP